MEEEDDLIEDAKEEDDVVKVGRGTILSDINDSTSVPIAVQDYIFRGDQLQDYSLYELTMWTTVENISSDRWTKYLGAYAAPDAFQSTKWQVRVQMNDEHPRQVYGSVRVVMFHKAERVPLLIGTFKTNILVDMLMIDSGPSIPHYDLVDQQEWRAFLLLVLFKPWRNMKDLQGTYPTWCEALDEFIKACGMRPHEK